MKRFFARLEHLQHANPILTACARDLASADALQEMFAFSEQRFIIRELDDLTGLLLRNWHAVDPVDAMRIQDELAFTLHIIEYSHLPPPDYCQLLLFIGV